MITYGNSSPTTGSPRTINTSRQTSGSTVHARSDSRRIEAATPQVNKGGDTMLRNISNKRKPVASSTHVDQSKDYATPRQSSSSNRTASNPNFSLALTGSPSSRKHRPTPLDLGNDSNISGEADSKKTGGFRGRVQHLRDGDSLKSPRMVLA